MKLSEVKNNIENLKELRFQLPNGQFVPSHFHVTEVGEITKDFIDCGGTIRREKSINFQLWEAGDFDHRVAPEKLASIISLSEKVLKLGDWEIEVEYQTETIGKYGLNFNGQHFELTTKTTNCLASESCGTHTSKSKIKLSDLPVTNTCTPVGGCC